LLGYGENIDQSSSRWEVPVLEILIGIAMLALVCYILLRFAPLSR
jgi:hypothetical protein